MYDLKSCVFVINKMSGRSDSFDLERIVERLGSGYRCAFIYLSEKMHIGDLTGFDRIVVAGGDGTLNSILNCDISRDAEIFFVPCGTFNEVGKTAKRLRLTSLKKVGVAENAYFSYVCAAGSFTPLGYLVPNKAKKRLKFFAYFKSVLSQYKTYRIEANVVLGDSEFVGPFTLIMAINSPRCFGFRFNKLFDPIDDSLQYLLIKSPKRKGFIGKIEIFFPFFRAFFIGFKHQYRSKRMFFISAKEAHINIAADTAFNFDGELRVLSGNVNIKACEAPFNIKILQRSAL